MCILMFLDLYGLFVSLCFEIEITELYKNWWIELNYTITILTDSDANIFF
jgi:hypothetical protein